VDSSLAAALLHEQGLQVVGITMKLWPCAEEDGGFTRPDACCSPTETIDARAVAVGTRIPHYVVDFEDRFRQGVVEDFLAGWARGETPNPCVRCNERIKFAALWEHAKGLGAAAVATGHYARTEQVFDRWLLRTAVDTDKDQTYFLFSLTQEQLAAARFPVGALTKAEVRAHARSRGMVTADKPESQDICFVNGSTTDFLRERIPEAFVPGDIVREDGTVLGQHQGLPGHTLGQRKGLGIATGEPVYVIDLDQQRNTVVVGPRERLLTDRLPLRECTWHLGHPPAEPVLVRTRHRGALLPARISADGAWVEFLSPRPRTAPGQAVVVYDQQGVLCLGGGWVTRPPATVCTVP